MAEHVQGWIVVPAYNEAAGLPAFVDTLHEYLLAIARTSGIEFTILVVDDGSTDGEAEVLEALVRSRPVGPVSLRYLSLVRNFGHQAALVAGLVEASAAADFVITMDADGEHPPDVLAALVAEWQKGAPIAHTARRPHAGLSRFKRWTSFGYYRVLRALSGLQIAAGMADFRLWDGDLLRQVTPVLPNCGSTRAFAAWLAPHAPVVAYEQRVVSGRVSRFTNRKMWSLALNGIVRYSDKPLRLAMVVGLLGLCFGAVLSVFVIWAALAGHTVAGWASTMLTITIFGSLECVAIGILGEYLLRNFFRHALPHHVVARRRVRPQAVSGSRATVHRP